MLQNTSIYSKTSNMNQKEPFWIFKIERELRKLKQKEKEGKNAMHKICMTYYAILHGLVVMAVDSQSEGPGFEYQSSQNLFWHSLTYLRLYNHKLRLDMHINNLKNFSTSIHQLLRDPRCPNGKQDSFEVG
jgi:hypothetical protein